MVNAILGASLMMIGGALAFRYRFSDRARCSCFCRCLQKRQHPHAIVRLMQHRCTHLRDALTQGFSSAVQRLQPLKNRLPKMPCEQKAYQAAS